MILRLGLLPSSSSSSSSYRLPKVMCIYAHLIDVVRSTKRIRSTIVHSSQSIAIVLQRVYAPGSDRTVVASLRLAYATRAVGALDFQEEVGRHGFVVHPGGDDVSAEAVANRLGELLWVCPVVEIWLGCNDHDIG